MLAGIVGIAFTMHGLGSLGWGASRSARSRTTAPLGDGMAVDCDPIIREIVRDETLTRGLGDEEARLLIDWVVDWAELLSGAAPSEEEAREFVQRLSRRARVISRFVQLWCDPVRWSHAAAMQLAASERLGWPFPVEELEPADLMDQILKWENEHLAE